MKILKTLTVALVIAASLVASNSAEAGFGSKFKKHFPAPRFFVPPAPRPVFVMPTPAPVHFHHYAVRADQVWVQPVYDTVIVGYEPCGTPIYRQVMVRAGYYQTVYRHVCSCGHSY